MKLLPYVVRLLPVIVCSLSPRLAAQPPVIVDQPASATVSPGTGVLFSVLATGDGSLGYQWLKDGVVLSGRTAATLTIPQARPEDIGLYSCLVSNASGSTATGVAALALNSVPFGLWQGLVAWYPFNGSTEDRSPFRNHGVVRDAALCVDRFGRPAASYAFSGPLNPTWVYGRTAYIEVPDAPALRPARAVTVSLWVKPTFDGMPYSWPHLISKRINLGGPGPFNSWVISTLNQTNLNKLSWGGEGRTGGWSPQDILTGGWQMLTLVLSETETVFFVDGAPIDRRSSPSPDLIYTSLPLLIGTPTGIQDQSWYGALDDVRIYNRALSDREVALLHASERVDAPPRFVALSASPAVLKVPNHKMVDVTVTARVVDDFDPNPSVRIVSVTSNEPSNGPGDGNTEVDCVITGPLSLQLRAERSGRGPGRIYTITLEAVDASGNRATGVLTVTCPKGN